MKIKVGIIGIGTVGTEYCHYLHSSEGYELVAVSDLSEKRLEMAMREFGVKAYRSLDKFLANPDFSLVIVATPNRSHGELAIEALEAGKDVAVEKPFCLSTAEADRVISTAEKSGRFVTVLQTRRYDMDFLTVEEILVQDIIGEVYAVHNYWHRWFDIRTYSTPDFDPHWRIERAHGGGLLLDQGAHLIDQVLQIIPAEPESVYCLLQSRKWAREVDDHFTLILRFTNGAVAQIEGSAIAKLALPRWVIIGDKGAVRGGTWAGADAARIEEFQVSAADFEGTYRTSRPAKPRHIHYFEALHEALSMGKEPPVKVEEAREVVLLLEAALESAKSGQVVAV